MCKRFACKGWDICLLWGHLTVCHLMLVRAAVVAAVGVLVMVPGADGIKCYSNNNNDVTVSIYRYSDWSSLGPTTALAPPILILLTCVCTPPGVANKYVNRRGMQGQDRVRLDLHRGTPHPPFPLHPPCIPSPLL